MGIKPRLRLIMKETLTIYTSISIHISIHRYESVRILLSDKSWVAWKKRSQPMWNQTHEHAMNNRAHSIHGYLSECVDIRVINKFQICKLSRVYWNWPPIAAQESSAQALQKLNMNIMNKNIFLSKIMSSIQSEMLGYYN